MTVLLDDHLLRDWMVGPDRTVRRAVDRAVVAMRDLAWRMGVLVSENRGPSPLGAEALAAAELLGGRILVSSRDDSPGVRLSCRWLQIRYATVAR
jgi:hypothetical protein